MKTETIKIGSIDAIIIGEASKDAFLFVHGHGGNKEEALAFAERAVPKGYQVVGIDLPAMALPWNVLELMNEVKSWLRDRYEAVSLRANSIGAWYSLMCFQGEYVKKALLVSPILDMKVYIDCREKKVKDYYEWVLNHPIDSWANDAQTYVLKPDVDLIVDETVYQSFFRQHYCHISVMEGGEHWFHTPEQLAFMARWEADCLGLRDVVNSGIIRCQLSVEGDSCS